MTRPDLTHLYLLLDRSGSMAAIRSDTVGGFAAFIEGQRSTQAGECRVTLAQFDNLYEVVYSSLPLAEVPALDLQPRGMTALLDGMGRLITDAGAELAALPEQERPGTVVVAIMTDGLENSSREWTQPAVKALVEQQTQQYSWQFIYLGANQDAIEVGESVGVSRDYSLTYAQGKAEDALRSTSAMISGLRRARLDDPNASAPAFTSEDRDRSGD